MDAALPISDISVRELLAGRVSVNHIIPEAIPKVLIDLDAAKQQAITHGKVDVVQKVHKLQKAISSLQARRQSAPRTATRLPVLRHTPPTRPSDSAELADLLNQFIAGRELDHEQLMSAPNLISLCRSKIRDLVDKGEYDEAQIYENALRKLQLIDCENSTEARRTQKRDQIAAKIAKTEEQLSSEKQKYTESLADFDQTATAEKWQLRETHAAKLAAFDEVTDAGMPHAFRKLSQRLLVLREQEKALISSKRYDEAAETKEIADALEKEEEEHLSEKYLEERAVQRQQMCDQYRANLKCVKEKSARNRLTLQQRSEAEIANKELAIENLKTRLEMVEAIMRTEAEATVRTQSQIKRRDKKPMPKRSSISVQTYQRYRFLNPGN
jgi:hypothetical protein